MLSAWPPRKSPKQNRSLNPNPKRSRKPEKNGRQRRRRRSRSRVRLREQAQVREDARQREGAGRRERREDLDGRIWSFPRSRGKRWMRIPSRVETAGRAWAERRAARRWTTRETRTATYCRTTITNRGEPGQSRAGNRGMMRDCQLKRTPIRRAWMSWRKRDRIMRREL